MHKYNRSSAWVRSGAAASIAAAIALGAIPGTALASDIDGHWGEAALQQWVGYGVLKGYGDGNYGPNDYITRAELVTLLDRVMDYQNSASNIFEDLDDNWYTENVLKGVAAGIITGDQNGTDLIRPNDHLTREEAAAIFARVMGLDTASAPSAGFVDQDKIADWATGSVNAMKAAGYVNGFEGSFNPTDNLTRAEAVTILDNIFSDLYQSAGEFTGEVEGSAVISSGDVTLKDAVVDGDLVIAEGVADGHVVLDNVTVRGKLIVRGGGINSVIIKGDSRISQVRVARQGAAVRLSVEGSSQVGTVVVDNGADTVRIEGTVETVSVQGASASVEVTGTVGSLSIADSAENAKVTVAADATVTNAETSAAGAQLVVSGTVGSVAVKGEGTTVRAEPGATISKVTTEAANTTVEGAGTVGSVVAGEGSEGTVVDTSGTKVENAGSGSVSAGGETVAPGGSVTTPDSSTGGSGSGSGGGSTVVTTASVSTFAELKSALESDTITTVNVTGSITADYAIAVNKTVNVQSGVTLDVMGKKLSGSGTVVVQSGGTLKINANYNGGEGSLLPSIETIEVQPGGTLASQTTNADPADVVFVGTAKDARIQTGALTTVTLGFADAYGSEAGMTRPNLTISGDASVPADQTWYTMFDSGEEAIGIDMTVASGTLTVSGTLKATSANSTGSTLTVAEGASLDVAGGTLDIAKKAAVTVNGTATSTGTISGTGSFAAPGFVKDGDKWVKKFAAGLGTAESPYQISNATEFKAIDEVPESEAKVYYQLIDSFTADTAKSGNGFFYIAENLKNAELDGNGKTITVTDDVNSSALFYSVKGSEIHDLNVELDYALAVYCSDTTFSNVDVTGSFTVTGNEAAYVIYADPDTRNQDNQDVTTINFVDCDANVTMTGSGDAKNYNAVFVGYARYYKSDNTSYHCYENLNFTNCTNKGTLICGKASMFLGNVPSEYAHTTITVANCSNDGLIQATSVSESGDKYSDNGIYSHFVSSNAHLATVKIGNSTYSGEQIAASSLSMSCGADGSFVHGPSDATLAIAKNEDGTFTITPAMAEGVSYYEVSLGLYATLIEGGTNRIFVTEKISAGDEGALISHLKHLGFVDETWVKQNTGAVQSELAENAVYTLDGTSYYYIGSEQESGCTLGGSPKNPQMVSVSAYDASGKLLASASL